MFSDFSKGGCHIPNVSVSEGQGLRTRWPTLAVNAKLLCACHETPLCLLHHLLNEDFQLMINYLLE